MIIDLSHDFPNLTKRERQVCAKLAQGLENKRIATELGISTRTVEDYRMAAYAKLGVNSVAKLLAKIYGNPQVIA